MAILPLTYKKLGVFFPTQLLTREESRYAYKEDMNKQSKRRGSELGMLLTPEIIRAIANTFPRVALNLHVEPNELWYREGQCSVVEVLQAKYDEVNINILNKELL